MVCSLFLVLIIYEDVVVGDIEDDDGGIADIACGAHSPGRM